jgi:hypothetical protein
VRRVGDGYLEITEAGLELLPEALACAANSRRGFDPAKTRCGTWARANRAARTTGSAPTVLGTALVGVALVVKV